MNDKDELEFTSQILSMLRKSHQVAEPDLPKIRDPLVVTENGADQGGVTHTVCSKCWEIRPVDDFPKVRGNRHGLSCVCRHCHNKRLSDYFKTPKGRAGCNARNARRHADKLKRTPKWANHKKIRAYYDEAQKLTEDTGVKHSVDHIIPLRGENVSGLHVENNLQVIPLEDNIRKNNKFDAVIHLPNRVKRR